MVNTKNMKLTQVVLFENFNFPGVSTNFDKTMVVGNPSVGNSTVTALTKMDDTILIEAKNARGTKCYNAVPWVHVKSSTPVLEETAAAITKTFTKV